MSQYHILQSEKCRVLTLTGVCLDEGGDDEERSDDSIQEQRLSRRHQKMAPFNNMNRNGDSSHQTVAAPFHVTLTASDEVSKALSRSHADARSMTAASRSDEKGLDGWKKRTDQLAAAVLHRHRFGPSINYFA